jgi:hypothetical protein
MLEGPTQSRGLRGRCHHLQETAQLPSLGQLNLACHLLRGQCLHADMLAKRPSGSGRCLHITENYKLPEKKTLSGNAWLNFPSKD